MRPRSISKPMNRNSLDHVGGGKPGFRRRQNTNFHTPLGESHRESENEGARGVAVKPWE